MVLRTVLIFSVLVQVWGLPGNKERIPNEIAEREKDTLILTNVVFRHGDRTPDLSTIYPNDPHINETYFPFGYGQLTLQGKQNAFRLGEEIHRRYRKFLGSTYSPFYLDSYSSNYPRTQMTLQAVHAALFPAIEGSELKEGLKWQPIPYTYFSSADDYLIATYRSCDLLYWLTDDIEKTPEYREIFSQYAPLYEYLSNHSGWNVNNTRLSFFIYNSMKTEEEWGFPLPQWAKPIYPELKSLASWFWKLVSSTTQLRRISIGNLIKKIILDAEAKVNGTLKPKEMKMFLYSGHDFTVVPILAALGHYNGEQLPYTSHVFFELHKINNVYGFKIYVQDFKQAEPRLVKVHDCDEFCPLEKFRAMFEDHFPGPQWCSV